MYIRTSLDDVSQKPIHIVLEMCVMKIKGTSWPIARARCDGNDSVITAAAEILHLSMRFMEASTTFFLRGEEK